MTSQQGQLVSPSQQQQFTYWGKPQGLLCGRCKDLHLDQSHLGLQGNLQQGNWQFLPIHYQGVILYRLHRQYIWQCFLPQKDQYRTGFSRKSKSPLFTWCSLS